MYKQYKAETKRLMGMMVNSIYTHKEIFLREIISNASDALDKLHFAALSEHLQGYEEKDASIILTIDKDHRRLIIEDNGIGMDEKDLEENLGVIAKSGSQEFSEEHEDESIIGQFGVGFYSAFMVADEVTVITRKYNSEQGYRWVSEGADGYEITKEDVEKVGTRVILKIREDGEEKDEYSQFLREYPLYKLVRKYSDYIRYPIKMLMPHPEVKKGSDPKNPEYIEKYEFETLNSRIPIWKKKADEVKEEDYNTYYKEHFLEKVNPLKTIHARVDSNVSYDTVLYIPAAQPSGYDSDEYKNGLELYTNGVKVMDHCDILLPEYYNFVRGIVETSDISLNVSREMLQHNHELGLIQKSLEKKIRQTLDKMMTDEREEYEKFFQSFGKHLKVCAMENYGANQDKLQDLLLFYSYKDKKLVTIKEYVDRMPKDQEFILYVTANSVEEAEKLPQLEVIKEKKYDVLFFTDRVDEMTVSMFGNYHDKQFKSIINGNLKLNDDKENKEASSEEKEVLKFIKDYLKDRVDDVKLSDRLRSHPVVLSSGDGMTFEMEKYFRSLSPNMPMKAKKILELNAGHEAFKKLENIIKENKETAEKYVEILYQQGRMIAGLGVEDPTGYTDLLCSLW